jgi:hypothetical protein
MFLFADIHVIRDDVALPVSVREGSRDGIARAALGVKRR